MPINEGIAKLAGKEQQSLGLPEGLRWYSAAPFGTMNQQDTRTALDDQEFFWVENFLLTGKASLRTLWDKGPAFYTPNTGATIVYFFWYTLNGLTRCAVFLSDGTAVDVQFPGGTVVPIAGLPGTFYTGGQLPVARQWGDLFLIIANNLTPNNYWIWDGTILYSPGTVGPFDPTSSITAAGSGYTSPPTVTAYGGSGGGVTATATVVNGSVVAVTVTNPGSSYSPSDTQVQLAFSGGGTDSGAILTAALYPASSVAAVILTSGGTGYTGVPTVAASGGSGSGFAATAVVTNGEVTAVNITNPGTGYTSTPTISFSGGSGSGAAAVATLSPGTVSGVTVVNGGSGFRGTPTLSFVGGEGTGAAATAIMTGGSISSVFLNDGGSGYTSVPAVVVQSGLNNAAQGVLDLMPFGVSGTSVETFQGRVWISNPAQIGPLSNGGVFNVSAPSSITNFATSAGGLLFTSNDSFLRDQYIALHQTTGFLYAIADSSVSVISNVQTSGSPSSTTLNYQNTSAQIGAAWRDTVQDYGQSILFANANGAQGLYGGAVQRISKKVDDLFVNAVLPPVAGSVTPTAAVANIYTIPCYLLNITIKDPTTNTTRTVMLCWNEREWCVAAQSSVMTFIGTQEINSVMTAWGTDGRSLYPLFQAASATLPKKLVTKLVGAENPYIIKQPVTMYLRATDKSANSAGIVADVVMEGAGVAQQQGVFYQQLPTNSAPNDNQPNFQAPNGQLPVWGTNAAAAVGTAIGMTVTTTSPDFILSDLVMSYRYDQAIFG